jgi:hypothetical protein
MTTVLNPGFAERIEIKETLGNKLSWFPIYTIKNGNTRKNIK